MIDTFRNIFKIADLRKRILFTVMILGIARIGTHIVTPGIDTAALANIWQNAQNTVFGLYDLFAGGAFSKAAVFGLGIMPYISASIIFQLLGAVWPAIQRLPARVSSRVRPLSDRCHCGTGVCGSTVTSGWLR